MISKHFITLNNKKNFYTLKKIDEKTIFFECKAANISQEFLKEDLSDLLTDLPNLILAEKKYKKGQAEIIRFRLSTEDKKKIFEKACKKGYQTISEYLRDLALKA